MAKDINFSERTLGAFASLNTDYAAMTNLMTDLAMNRELYDEKNDKIISKSEANAKILQFSRMVLGITDINDKKAVRRAIRDNGREWLDIIEDTIDSRVSAGFVENEWFNEIVDSRNLAYGDRQDFTIEKDSILSVAKAGVSHHNHILQRVAEGETIPVSTQLYVVKVGADINKYVVGQVDWNTLIDAISKSYIVQTQAEVFENLDSAANQLPIQTGFVGTGTLSSSTKAAFDNIIQNVSDANDGAEVVIMGANSALKKVNDLAATVWAADGQKDSVMNTGHIGLYEGTRLIEVPNRFKTALPITGSGATLPDRLFRTDRLLFIPVIGEAGKFIKFVDEGDTEILEKSERGDYTSDIQTYEVQRRFGVATVIGRYFGQWTL